VPAGIHPGVEERLASFAEVTRNEGDANLTEAELAERIGDVDGCIISRGSAKFTREVLEGAGRLRIIGHAGGTVRPYVTDEVFQRGIVVTNAASEIALSVAEFALASAINCLRGIPLNIEAMRAGRERELRGRSREAAEDLGGQRVGVVGVGNVGRRFIGLLRPFEAEVLVYDPYLPRERADQLGVKPVPLRELLSESRVILVSVASIPATRGLIGAGELRLIQDGAVFINVSHAGVIDEKALFEELRTGRFRAALDVLGERLPPESDLRRLENVLLTPHIAGSASNRRLLGVVVEDLRLFFSGKEPRNRITGDMLKYLA